MAIGEPVFSEEMLDQVVLDVFEYVKVGGLSAKKVIGVSREMIAKCDDDGNLVYYDIRVEGKETPILLDTMIGRIRTIVQSWKKYIAPLMETLVLEAAYQHALKAKDNVTSFKAAAEMIMPKESVDDGTPPALSPRVAAILQQSPVGTTIVIGQGSSAQGVGDKGHEGADRVHPVADRHKDTGQGSEDTPVEMVPSGNGEFVHAVHEGRDITEGSALPDTPVPSEDSVDNDSRDDMGFD